MDQRAIPQHLKESYLAVKVFGHDPADLDRDDSIVRLQMGGLRKRLASYYESGGFQDRLRIDVPNGSYVADYK